VKGSTPEVLVASHLDGWETQWDRLVDASPIPSPFMRSWWLIGTGGTPAVFVLVVDGDRLLGGLPLEEANRLGLQRLRIMSSGPLCPDHMDLLMAPGEEETTISLIQAWLRRPGARLMDLEGVGAHSRLVETLPGPVRREPFAVAPWGPLPPDSKAYLAALPSALRRKVKRATEHLTAQGATHRTHRGSAAVRSLDTLRQLHRAQWGERSHFLPNFERFAAGCRLGAEADEVAVHELATGDTVISSVVTFEVARRVSLYQSARLTDPLWRDTTTVLLAAIITDACDRGFTEVDFLRGAEPYKHRFAPNERQLCRLLAATGGTGRAALATKSIQSTTRLAAERSLHAARTVRARFRP
jgi:CelD/BcsL family acetyltransferase involved in cellulose biosynthesis